MLKPTLIIVLVVIVFAGGWVALSGLKRQYGNRVAQNRSDQQSAERLTGMAAPEWEFTGAAWQVYGTPPACPDPLEIPSPVELDSAKGILYPGQIRGRDYKPHGGIQFSSPDITVRAPLDATLRRAARYLQDGEEQILLEFLHPCGILYRFDHLRDLAGAAKTAAAVVPLASDGDSRTTNISPPASVSQGEVVATAVGFAKTANYFFDFGVYDLRQPNDASKQPNWSTDHRFPELENYGICWLTIMKEPEKSRIASLPAGSSESGATSDYCR